jgi:copper chaperone CopZ
MVPMCCDKCKEKVQEELSEVDGVDSVRCDPKNSRVIVTGSQSIDIERCLKKAERAVKKKCELVSNQAEGGTPNSKKVTSPSGYYETVAKTGILAPPPVSSSRGSPGGRPTLARMPSFASGKVTQHDGVGPGGQDYEAKDYTGFRRMPSFGKSRHHEAEYISSYDERPEPRASLHREFNAPIRRMPSFNRSRYHDAEYMAADDDRDYSPRSFYDNGSSYTASYNDRPSLLSQVSFSKVPVENPNYVKQIANY